MKVVVTLSKSELQAAVGAGVNRRLRAMERKRRPRQDGIPEHKQHWWQSDIIGAIGEACVSKMFGVPFHDLADDRNGKDVLDYQVRATENPKAGLKVRVGDDNNDIFILAQVHNYRALIHGYSTGSYVKAHGERMFESCWVVPNDSLWSVTDLVHPIEWSNTVAPFTT